MPYVLVPLRALFACSLLLITSCGGGGSEPTPNPEPTPVTYSLTGTPQLSVNENENYTFTATSSGFTNTSLTYSIENKPEWAEFNNATGELSGIPSYEDAGEYNDITISGTDGKNTASLPSFKIRVINVNRTPTFNSPTNYTVNAKHGIGVLFDIFDADEDTVTTTIIGMPNWLYYISEDNLLEGVPTSFDIKPFSIEVIIDDGKSTISKVISFNIDATNSLPVLNSPKAYTINEMDIVNVAFDIFDSDNDNTTVSVNNLPAWLAYNQENNTLIGAASPEDSGEYSIEVLINDGYATNTVVVDITVVDVEFLKATWFIGKDIELFSASTSGVLYFYVDSEKLVTFDNNFQVITNIQEIDNVSKILYHNNHKRLYIGLSDGNIKALSSLFELSDFSSINGCVNDLVDADDYLIALDCGGYSGAYNSINSIGAIVDNTDSYFYSSQSNAWNSTNNRLYHFSEGLSPKDIYYRTVNNTGEFIYITNSPYHGDFSIYGPIVISSDGTKVLIGTGDIYNAEDLTINASVATSFDSAIWLGDGSLLLITINSDTTQIQRLDDNYQPIETSMLAGSFKFAKVNEDNTIIVTQSATGLNVHQYEPNNDVDGDGVENSEDSFPTDVAASVDSDFDGYPDHWNVGKSLNDSTTDLVIDFFPLDSACWLSEHAVEGNSLACDYSATMPLFTPDEIIGDVNGNIYFLNKSTRKIYRWLADGQTFGNPLSVDYDDRSINKVIYSEDTNRLFIGYSSGNITFVELEQLNNESYFATTAESVDGLAAAGKFILAQDNSGAWASHYIFDEGGQQTDKQEWNYYSDTYTWNEYNSRVYFIGEGYLHYEHINQSLGVIDYDGANYNYYNPYPPIQLFNNGTKVILGNGNIYDANTLNLEGSLMLQAIDIATTASKIVSLENIDTNAELTIWHSNTLENIDSIDVQGTPLKLFSNGESINVVSLLADGNLHIEVLYLSDDDEDGIPRWWEELYSLDDNNTSDAVLDTDLDGLTNLEEYTLHTNPNIADTDLDGVNDGDEVNIYNSLPLNSDTDADGISDGDEVNVHFTNPIKTDSDEDGLTDFDEINTYASNPLSQDSDNDGIADLIEVENNLDVNLDDANVDTDLDGLINIDEVTQNTDPHNSDSDNDGLTDGDEVHTYLTLPLNRDSDGDNMADDWEVSSGLDPLDNTDAIIDSDLDTYSNIHEYYLGSDPADANSTPVAKPWNSYQGNADNAGFVGIDIDVADISFRWTATLPYASRIGTSVIATQGKVINTYANTFGNKVAVALSALDGSISWQKDYGNINSIDGPSFNREYIYFSAGNNDSYLYSLNISDGTESFSSLYTNLWDNYKAPSILDDEIYIAGGSYGGMYKFDADTGSESWFVDLERCDDWVPAVDSDNVYYYEGTFKIASKETGEVLRSSSGDVNDNCYTPVVANNVIVTLSSALQSFDKSTAELLWQVEHDGYSHYGFLGTAAVALDKVYVNKGGVLMVYDEFSGEELWTWQPENSNALANNIALSMNLAFVSDNDNTYAIDINTHEKVWSYPVSGQVSLSLEGALYIQSVDGVITAINIAGDSDDDGLDDWWEKLYGFNINDATDASLNSDSDALTNLDEFTNGTNPLVEDSDNDGINDSSEVNTYHSNPNKVDTDDDGMPDLWEVNQGFDLLNPIDAVFDADNDTVPNVDEYTQDTDPNDALSIPVIIYSATYSFEGAILPIGWKSDDNLDSSWGVTNLKSSNGDYSILSSGRAAISFSGYFSGNELTFEARDSCSSGSFFVGIDDEERIESFSVNSSWQIFSVLIPSGQHTIRFESPSCSENYIDNISLSPIENLFATETHMVTTANHHLNFFDIDGELIKRVYIPYVEPERHSSDARDLVVLTDGRVVVYNGTDEPSLSIYTPEKHQWQHITDDEWSSLNNDSYGGIATIDNSVFVTNINTSHNDSSGIIRIDLSTQEFTYIDGNDYRDLTIGLDGYLYAMTEVEVVKYNTSTLELLGTTSISEAQSLAVDEQGNIFTASPDGDITQYSTTGVQLNSINIDAVTSSYSIHSTLQDIDINDYGEIFVTNINQQVLITDASLNSIALYFEDNDRYSEFLALPPFIDNDLDGMPRWWENKYDLSDIDASDANGDLDVDGVSNITEYLTDTDPLNVDSDGDTLSDYEELITFLTNPLVSDSDGDSLDDAAEINIYLTDPLDADTDGDRFSDGDEINYHETDPLDVNSIPELDLVDFNSGVIPSTFNNSSSGSQANWYIDNNALRSGDIDDNEMSSIVYTKTFSAGTLTFDVLVSSDGIDFFTVYLDGSWTSIRQYAQETVSHSLELTAGEHSIHFSFIKDDSYSFGSDAVWVDNILFTPNQL